MININIFTSYIYKLQALLPLLGDNENKKGRKGRWLPHHWLFSEIEHHDYGTALAL